MLAFLRKSSLFRSPLLWSSHCRGTVRCMSDSSGKDDDNDKLHDALQEFLQSQSRTAPTTSGKDEAAPTWSDDSAASATSERFKRRFRNQARTPRQDPSIDAVAAESSLPASSSLSSSSTSSKGTYKTEKSKLSPDQLVPWALHKYLEPFSLDDLPSVKQPSEEEDKQSFASLFRHSSFVQLGDFSDKEMIGYVMEVVEDDLYIDFGCKFHCVCTRPAVNGHLYVRGAKVRVKLVDVEMTAKFLASKNSISLLEADAQLLGLDTTTDPQEITLA